MGGALSDLDFGPGLDLQRLVLARFNAPVSFSQSFLSNGFLLVASFALSAIKLDAHSVGLILQSCLGGIAFDFCVQHLSGWMYQFMVSSKDVGFLIYRLKSFSCIEFEVFFSLWGAGGPNWRKKI